MRLAKDIKELMEIVEGASDRLYVYREQSIDLGFAKFLLVGDDEESEEDPETGGYVIEYEGTSFVDFLEVAIVQDIKSYVDRRVTHPSESDYLHALLHYDEHDAL